LGTGKGNCNCNEAGDNDQEGTHVEDGFSVVDEFVCAEVDSSCERKKNVMKVT
jgi:hypothetical protein